MGKLIDMEPVHGKHWAGTYQVVIADYHEEYPIPEADDIEMRRIWDGSEASDILGAAGLPDSTDEGLLYKVLDKQLIGHACKREDIYNLDSPMMIIWRITGPRESLERLARIWCQQVLTEVPAVSGDDTYYDYFPNWVEMYKSFCEALGLNQLFLDTVNDPRFTERYNDDEGKSMLEGWRKS